MENIKELVEKFKTEPPEKRVEVYNQLVKMAASLVKDITTDPATSPQLILSEKIEANTYNPNKVASVEFDLLEQSMSLDGITMPIVVFQEGDRTIIVDGFHRYSVGTDRLHRKYLPCSIIHSALGDRIASTVRHNRARGKHQVDLMAALIKDMMQCGWDDERIATALGMSVEELLRLKQMVGAAALLAGERYTRCWDKRH